MQRDNHELKEKLNEIEKKVKILEQSMENIEKSIVENSAKLQRDLKIATMKVMVDIYISEKQRLYFRCEMTATNKY
jgi:cell division septum initiation protein DivIVA